MLYEPTNRSRASAPLLVLLHGCKQGAADFAAGTRMNEAAEAAGVVVLYPNSRSRPISCAVGTGMRSKTARTRTATLQ